ncbi:MAG: 4-hydroxy-3-methylbut-2-enyl diphosphate reductase [Rickettsiales bacterium]|nr:4-hydroxy-3-methylbut-2-enyl diphosphate reductase [Rickettsiales bacterium]
MRNIELYLATPRGFCAGVDRAIEIVERSLRKYGGPIYVRHEIVHNKHVVEALRKKGAIFVSDISEIPEGSHTIFSAHGVSDQVEQDATVRDLSVIDATCPLVKKVHKQVEKYDSLKSEIILIGHKGHPEVEGTSGRAKQDVYLVESVEDVQHLAVRDSDNLFFVTQTTLSIDDTADIIDALAARYPNIQGPSSQDICYATQNRQDAVKSLINNIDLLLVIGASNSSNSNRLRDIGTKNNLPSYLIENISDLDKVDFTNKYKIGVTAGASAPEFLMDNLINYMKDKFIVELKTIHGKQERISFNIPKVLQDV